VKRKKKNHETKKHVGTMWDIYIKITDWGSKNGKR
jgi:hypothetical protein